MGNSLVSSGQNSALPLQGAPGLIPGGELRQGMPHGMAKKKKSGDTDGAESSDLSVQGRCPVTCKGHTLKWFSLEKDA